MLENCYIQKFGFFHIITYAKNLAQKNEEKNGSTCF